MHSPPIVPTTNRPQTPARDALAHDLGALIELLLSSLEPTERHHLLTASRALGWDLERIGDPVRGPLGRLSEESAVTLLCAALDAAWSPDVYMIERDAQRVDDELLNAALDELRRKVLA